MAEDQSGPPGPDLTQGILLAELPDGCKLVGHVGEEAVLLARRGAEVFAIGVRLGEIRVVDAGVIAVASAAALNWRSGAVENPVFQS